MRKRLQAYSTGKDKHPDIKYIMIVEDDKRVEKCAKLFAKAYQYKGNKELYKMHNDILKRIVFDCAKIDKNVADDILHNKDLNTYIVYDDSKTIEYLNLNGDIIGMSTTKITNKITNKISKNTKTKKMKQK